MSDQPHLVTAMSISGNTALGVALLASSSTNVVVGNRIGTNADGTTSVPNEVGIAIDASNGNTIGDLSASANGNLISGNSDYGIVLQGNASNNRVSYNSIGTTANGAAVLPNGEIGVFHLGGATDNRTEKNVIGGHNLTDSGAGVGFAVTAGPANVVDENFLGVGRDGTTELPNRQGIAITADGQIIGSEAGGNIIGHNEKAGITITSFPGGVNPVVTDNVVTGNLIGTNGSDEIGNGEFGVWVNGAANDNTITNNYVSGNFFAGIALTDGPSSNDILNNFIGINVGSTQAISNGIGIWVRQATDNTISQNLVCGNDIGTLIGRNIGLGTTARAVESFQSNSTQSNQGGTFTSGNRVHTNIMGVGPSGAIPNRIGIAVGENARNNFIGTTEGGNLISGNTNPAGWGLLIGTLSQTAPEDTFPQFNTIQSNRISTLP